MSLATDSARPALEPGARLGPYEVLGLVGAGGMGQVYRARDPRLGRDVALKVLAPGPGTTEERFRRFEQEARAAGALNHPNLISVLDAGRHDGAPYLVFELLQGTTLRSRLGAGALPLRKALDYGVQMAHGLAAAHEKGIVHRDLKPENTFVTTDGRVKILDFGLAKLRPELDGEALRPGGTTPEDRLTRDGAVLGTAAYMSPEQVRGRRADARSDVFSLGAVLYEMLSGRRAFAGETSAETMTAILRTDPSALSGVPAGVEAIVRRCLEKEPAERFQSARDVAFALSAMETASGTPVLPRTGARPAWRPWLAAALVGLAALAGAFTLGRRTVRPQVPTYTQLTFSRGLVQSARFAPDGLTVVYGAGWEGHPSRLFIGRADSLESRPLDLPQGDILSISRNGEMAILLGRFISGRGPGTLARVSLAGGAPRELATDVTQADWSPDGQELAIVRVVGGANRLEYPIGRVLRSNASTLLFPAVSPDGYKVAFLDYVPDGGVISIVSRDGHVTALAKARWPFGLAWSPRGDEVWYTESGGPFTSSPGTLSAVDMRGAKRVLARLPGPITLNDVSRAGRVLLTVAQWRYGLAAVPPGETREKDLSWFDGAMLAALSPDGRTLLFSDRGGVYLRRTDGSPAVRLGPGRALDLSPDGKWALACPEPADGLVLLPTGAGETRSVRLDGLESYALGGGFFPDGRHLYVNAREGEGGVRVHVLGLDGEGRRAVTPAGFAASSNAVSPDGKQIVVSDTQGQFFLAPVDGGDLRPLEIEGSAGWTHDRKASSMHWSADGRYVYVANTNKDLPIGIEQPNPLRIDRIDVRTGRLEPWRQIAIADPAGVTGTVSFLMTPDQKAYAYSYGRILCALFLVDGLR
jgi:eukaryotic-like serine/threonine-protein kinase